MGLSDAQGERAVAAAAAKYGTSSGCRSQMYQFYFHKARGLNRAMLRCATGAKAWGRALGLMRAEIERGMKLMGCTSIGQLSRDNLRFR
jgi:isopentenyl diphosphate isomerase/L-lactate dehydrogenase-like FMN-dependent dehydrogenase